ncbi:hypothetical protein WN55_06989 [Dufourea novaeangliae]|uniref:Uncharacterized protein n=1 Tax=Dufourea novaeangliae TaxID=178035 RepID=A0A154P0Q5_DUFNO|nr:hypothetical protein WN55_06989 [Dufourea novaeangliae]
MRKGGEPREEEIVNRERRLQEEDRWKNIENSKYNKWYKMVKGRGIPGYLMKGWGEGRWQRVARFRLGNEMRENRYWLEEEKRRCRICGWREETWEHVWEECMGWREEMGWHEMVREVLGDEGEGEEWMRKVEERREGVKKRENGWENE